MASFARIALCLAVCSIVIPAASAQEPAAKAKAKVEFRWLERKPVKDLTDEKGIQTTCGPELSYPHTKPVLTNKDVSAAGLRSHGSVMGLPGDHYTVSFELTAQARKTLVEACGDAAVKELAVFVDGKYWGTWAFRKDKAVEYVPQAGFIPSKVEAERIVAAFK